MKPEKTPDILSAIRIRHASPFGNMHVIITVDPKAPDGKQEREIFAHLGKAGDLPASDLEGMCRLASVVLRMGGELPLVIDQLTGIGTSLAVSGAESASLADSLAQALQAYQGAVERAGGVIRLLTCSVRQADS